jgi:hypothetical protein
MSVQVKELLNLKKGTGNTLNLYYTSSELPKGRMLAAMTRGATQVTKL